MDRYETFTDYAAAKHRIFANQSAADVAVLNADDETVSSWARGLRAHVINFSSKKALDKGLFLRGNELVSRITDDEIVLLRADEMKLRGLHNVENVLAAFAAGMAAGANPISMRETVKAFRPVEHRLEFVAEIECVKFYNDSKATSVDATLKALEAFRHDAGKLVLILGGRGKKAPYSPLVSLVREKVRALVLIGEDTETIAKELGGSAPSERATDMQDAVRRSFKLSEPGDVVLLAPACASFDMFDSFEHRGTVFKEEVSNLGSKI
jgi:UDP-N-acetylmuramoylalanine--D-glutamate ligase